jgi:hypothetical protein
MQGVGPQDASVREGPKNVGLQLREELRHSDNDVPLFGLSEEAAQQGHEGH